ncbi:MAG: glycosyltransferase [Acidimicrobiales bacterium]
MRPGSPTACSTPTSAAATASWWWSTRWAERHAEPLAALEASGVTVDRIDVPPPGTWAARLGRGRTLRAVADRHEVDVAFFPRDVAPKLDQPVVIEAKNRYAWEVFSESGPVGGPVSAWLLRRAARRSARRAAAVLAVSGAMRDAIDADIAVAAIVHHGCALPEHDRTGVEDDPDGPFRAAMVGTVMGNKGIDVAVAGVAEARRAGRPWELHVHGPRGDAAYAAEVERLADELLGVPVLRGPAYGPDLVEAYHQAHVLVVGSVFESFCFPLVEAMRSSCVVVAPDCPLVHELCGPVAATYEEGDPASLAAALEVAWTERHERRHAGLLRSRAFTWEHTVEITLDAVRAAVGAS